MLLPLDPFQSLACGVGHIFCFCSLPSISSASPLPYPSVVLPGSCARSVGHNPDSVSSVRSTCVDCSHNSPSRIIPHLGKVSKHSVESSKSKHWAVLHEDKAGSNFANDPCHVPPHGTGFSVDSGSLSSAGNVGAGEAARYDINTVSPRSSVKGLNIIPDRERRQAAVVLPSHEHACGIGVPLHSAHGAPSKQVPAEYSAASACEKSQLIHLFLSCLGFISQAATKTKNPPLFKGGFSCMRNQSYQRPVVMRMMLEPSMTFSLTCWRTRSTFERRASSR